MIPSGLLLIDKPKGPTSHDIVNRVRRLLNKHQLQAPQGPASPHKKSQNVAVGHAGTLDPLATGLLVLLLGKATKISDSILQANKQYLAHIRLGVETNTWDAQGQTLNTHPIAQLTAPYVLQQAQALQNEKLFPLPIFSAVKHKGQRLHQLARRGMAPDKAILKPMQFFNLKNLHYHEGLLRVQIDCSKGSYIRSFAHVLGQKLGCGAHIENLRRLGSEPFRIEQALTLDQLENNLGRGFEEPYFIPLEKALQNKRKIFVRDYDRYLLLHGQVSHSLANLLILEQKQAQVHGQPITVQVACGYTGRLLALVTAHPNKMPTTKRMVSK